MIETLSKSRLSPTTKKILTIAVDCDAFARHIDTRAASKFPPGKDMLLLPSALSFLSLDGTRVLEALVYLAAEYSFAAPTLLRTLLDIFVSTIVLTKSNEPELAAFKYFLSGYRHMKNDPDYKRAGREVDAKRHEIGRATREWSRVGPGRRPPYSGGFGGLNDRKRRNRCPR